MPARHLARLDLEWARRAMRHAESGLNVTMGSMASMASCQYNWREERGGKQPVFVHIWFTTMS